MAGQSSQLTRAEAARLQTKIECHPDRKRGSGGQIEAKLEYGTKPTKSSAMAKK
jgi:hypothetical protein